MTDRQENRRFLKYFLPVQDTIRGYLGACGLDSATMDDLFQEVSVTLWEKFGDFDESRSFKAWAIGITRFQVLKWKQKMARQKVVFCDETIERLAETAAEYAPESNARYEALEECVDLLPPRAKMALTLRFHDSLDYREMAGRLAMKVGAVEMTMVRLRRKLKECVENKLAGRETTA